MRARPVSVKHSSSGTDISLSLARALDVERTICSLRWIALVVGPALAWLAGSVAVHSLLLTVVAAGALVNLAQGYLLRWPLAPMPPCSPLKLANSYTPVMGRLLRMSSPQVQPSVALMGSAK